MFEQWRLVGDVTVASIILHDSIAHPVTLSIPLLSLSLSLSLSYSSQNTKPV